MKNITLSADSNLIERAREKATRHRTSLNQEFRDWLTSYINEDVALDYEKLWKPLRSIDLQGNTLSREERNER